MPERDLTPLHRTMLDAMPDAVWLKDPSGVYLGCNRRFEAFFGHAEALIVGRRDEDFVSPELAAFFRQNDARAVQHGEAVSNEEWLTYASDGHRELVQTIKTPVHDAQGQLVGVLGVARDITALRRAEDEQRALFAHNPVPMLIYDLRSLQLVQVNDAFCELYGHTPPQALALQVLDLFVPAQRDAARQRLPQLHGLQAPGDWQHQCQDGRLLDVDMHSHELTWQGRPCRLVAVTDISRFKRAERRDRSRFVRLESLARELPLPELLAQLAQDHSALFPASRCVLTLAEADATGAIAMTPGPGPADTCHLTLAIMGGAGECLGHMALYGPALAPPDAEECGQVAFAVQLAALAIQQHRQRERLRDSHTRMRDVLHAIPDLVWLKDAQDRFLDCNAAFERLTGRPRAALIGQQDAGLVPLPGPVNLTLLRERQSHVCEVWGKAPEQTMKALYEVIRTPLYTEQGQAVGVLGVARDITVVKAGARALAEQDQLVATMFKQTTDAIVLMTPEGEFFHFNDAACQGLGYSREAFGKLRAAEVQAELAPAQIQALVARALAGEAIEIETRHHRADGSLQHVALTLRGLSLGGQAMVSVVWRDISQTRAHETRIRRLNQAYAVLGGVNEAIARIRDTRALFTEVCRIAVEVGGFRMAWIGGPDENGWVRPCVHAGYSNGYAESLRIAMRSNRGAPLDRMIESGQPCVINEIAAEDTMAPWHAELLSRGYRSLALFPIALDRPDWYCLAVYSEQQQLVDEEQLMLYGRAALDLGFALDFANAEQARQREQGLREAMMESVAGLFFAIDHQGRLVLWNRRLEAITGYGPKELDKRPVLSFFEGLEREHIAQAVEASFRQGESQAEAVLVSKSGERRPHLFVSRRMDHPGNPMIVGTGIDITDRVAAEAELRSHRLHLEALVAQRTTELEAANRQLQREDARLRAMLSLSQKASSLNEAELSQAGMDSVVQLTESQQGCLHTVADTPGDSASPLMWVACSHSEPSSPLGAIANGSGGMPWEDLLARSTALMLEASDPQAPLPCPPGVARMLCAPVLDNDTVALVLCVANKPTPYAPADLRELQLFGNDLWRILRRRRIELALERAKAEADAANQAKSAFLANMSHEIRTPMNAIVGFAHLLRRDPLTPRQQDHLTKITDASEHLAQVINDVLDLSKIEARKVKLELADFSLDTSLQRVLALVGETARAKGLRLHTTEAPIGLWLRGDRLRLEQVLLNLLGNAVKFTARGEVSLRVAAQPEPGLRLHFDVADTGIGIAPDQLPNLFQAFEQADVSTTRRFGGSGLGLTISKGLVELMGGQLSLLHSTPGQGSCFRVDLPFEAAAQPQAWFQPLLPAHALGDLALPAAPAAALLAGPVNGLVGARVLLVEDSPINQEVARALLTETGALVSVANDGAEALVAFAQASALDPAAPFDLVLMDVQMPVMDGLAATRALRQRPNGAQVPIIAMTANAFAEDREHCLRAGMNDYLAKPVDPLALRQCLSRWLAGRPASPPRIAPPAPRPAAALPPFSSPPPAGASLPPAPTVAAPATATPAQEVGDGPHVLQKVAGLDWPTALARTRHQWPLYRRALQLFVTHHGDDAGHLRQASLQDDWAQLRQQAHALAGAAAAVGASTVAERANALEATCRSVVAQTAPADAWVLPLIDALNDLLADLRSALANPPASGSGSGQAQPLSHTQLRQALSQLAPLLASHDTAACTWFEQQGPSLHLALGEAVLPLAQAIEGFQFEQAHAWVRAWLAQPDTAADT